MIGKKAFILPAASTAFAGRWGVIESIDTNSQLPIAIRFEDTDSLFYFSHDEILTEEEYKEAIEKGIHFWS